MHHRFTRSMGAAAIAAALLAGAPAAQGQSTLNRPADPVVLTGADIPSLNGITPQSLVAFRYNNGWVQIPVQVDERNVVDFGTIFHTAPTGKTILAYTDANTWTGADPDPMIDANDEIVFMAKQAGGRAPSFSEPAGVVANSGIEMKVTDPLNTAQKGYVYLFRQNGTLDPGAGGQYGTYTFNLLSGNYKTTYKARDYNPENSSVSTANYYHDYKDRWVNEILKIKAGASTEVDILDRHKVRFALGFCGRSEETFASAGGAFAANKNGPVRGIRSYLGANSGRYTQRDHFFYEQRQDLITYLRVHQIPGVVDFFDYSANAIGMRYYNPLVTGGVTIDGVPDQVPNGMIDWEMVTGEQGTLVHVHQLFSDIQFDDLTSVYVDDLTPPETQCTGDSVAYAQSGPWATGIPCTDPTRCDGADLSYLTMLNTLYYGPPNLQVSVATRANDQARNPLLYVGLPWRSN